MLTLLNFIPKIVNYFCEICVKVGFSNIEKVSAGSDQKILYRTGSAVLGLFLSLLFYQKQTCNEAPDTYLTLTAGIENVIDKIEEYRV